MINDQIPTLIYFISFKWTTFQTTAPHLSSTPFYFPAQSNKVRYTWTINILAWSSILHLPLIATARLYLAIHRRLVFSCQWQTSITAIHSGHHFQNISSRPHCNKGIGKLCIDDAVDSTVEINITSRIRESKQKFHTTHSWEINNGFYLGFWVWKFLADAWIKAKDNKSHVQD